MKLFKKMFGPPDITRLKAENNISGLIEATTYSKNDDIRRQAITALGEHNEKAVIEKLIWLMDNEKSEEICSLAVDSLTRVGVVAVKPLVEKASLPSKNAIKVLFRIGPVAIQPLTEVLIESDWEIRKAVYYAFEKLRWRPSSENGLLVYSILHEDWDYFKKIGERVIETLTLAATSQSLSDKIRRGAALVLATISNPVTMRPILQAIPNEPIPESSNLSWEESIEKAESLIALGDLRAYINLLETLKQIAVQIEYDDLFPMVIQLNRSISRKARLLPEEFLISIVNLQDLSTFKEGETRTVKAKDPGHDDYEIEVTDKIICSLDCSSLRGTASKELERRSINSQPV